MYGVVAPAVGGALERVQVDGAALVAVADPEIGCWGEGDAEHEAGRRAWRAGSAVGRASGCSSSSSSSSSGVDVGVVWWWVGLAGGVPPAVVGAAAEPAVVLGGQPAFCPGEDVVALALVGGHEAGLVVAAPVQDLEHAAQGPRKLRAELMSRTRLGPSATTRWINVSSWPSSPATAPGAITVPRRQFAHPAGEGVEVDHHRDQAAPRVAPVSNVSLAFCQSRGGAERPGLASDLGRRAAVRHVRAFEAWSPMVSVAVDRPWPRPNRPRTARVRSAPTPR